MHSARSGSPIVDLDSHFYEPAAIWDEYVPSRDRALARSALWHGEDGRGNRLTVLNGRVSEDLDRSRINRRAVWRPGMTPDDVGDLDPTAVHGINPGANEPAARMADLDAMGVDHAIAYPTLFAEHFPMVEDPLAADVLAHAYNDWSADFAAACGGRVHPMAVLPMQSLLLAQRELDRVAEAGVRGVALRPMFYPSYRSEYGPGGAYLVGSAFAPLWRQIEDVGLVAAVHASLAITNPEGTSAGRFIERVSRQMGIGHSVAETVAYLQDNAMFLAAACYHGLMEEWPALKLVLAHGGATMVPLVLEKAETYLWLGGNSRVVVPGGPVSLEPAEVFAEHPAVVQFDSWESGVAEMADVFAAKAGWGSRYPNHDASAPAEAIALLEENGVEPDTVARLMGGNASELFGLDRS